MTETFQPRFEGYFRDGGNWGMPPDALCALVNFAQRTALPLRRLADEKADQDGAAGDQLTYVASMLVKLATVDPGDPNCLPEILPGSAITAHSVLIPFAPDERAIRVGFLKSLH